MGALLFAAPILLAGCNTESKVSAQDQANIRGTGAPSASQQADMQRRMQEAQQRMSQGRPAGAGQTK
jgi:hypothetical protein